jgi:hypothetical protein
MKNRKPKSIIMWIAIAFLLFIIIYDAYACQHRDKMETVSEMITRASMRYLILPVIAGILIGHFFWSQRHVFKGMR